MLKRALIFIVLGAIVAIPFTLRPTRVTGGRVDDTVVVVTPHNEAIRYEFGRGFSDWYRQRTARSVRVEWRVVGGTSDIARFLESAYAAAFENEWTRRLHREWTDEIQATFQKGRLPANASPAAKEARAAFLASNVGCGIDVFFGGDAYQLGKEAEAGRLIASELLQRHAEWFGDDVMPGEYGGEPFRDRDGRWFGVVLSTYGIVFNRDGIARLGVTAEPRQWSDLANPRLSGEIALADPSKSGSVCEAFENIIQQQIHRRASVALAAKGTATDTTQYVRDGWRDALQLIQRIGANARYFTDSSQKPLIDVAAGDCAAGLCIDFYGRQQQEALRRRGAPDRIAFVSPLGGSAASVDPIAILRGAPHREVAEAFVEYTLSLDGQKLWSLRPGMPGGPERFALRRIPVRKDFYSHEEWRALRSDPEDAPYRTDEPFTYHREWTGSLFREIGFVVRVMCQDSHAELASAWRAIDAAPEPQHSRALAVLQDVARVDYERVTGEIHERLNASDRVEEVRLATELGAWFRANYARAEAIARGRQ